MSQQKKFTPTTSELEILQFLWSQEPATVKEVHAYLTASQQKEIRYTTTLKTMQVMLERGLLKREIEGRKHLYRAALEKDETQNELLDKFLKLTFGGSAMKLVMKALGNYQASNQELDDLKKYIDSIDQNKKP
ncbi:MAG: BlaI/MecI/CopY family transcriptional regulator [Bacteroidota bacterium]